ncbi:MAG: potassium-transporting ATPase potassium-binding subunit [Cyanobacteriota bacterium erpe_2018_sw_39hr_WHONDRS-SW48-000098_B_bin.30]|jgi:K+-transporting ATPase ATPase A chain|nr:potassium-transporting ATPase subunit KdpA [Candidatus Obscuribacter sp.]MDQ5964387.1 potassium-transporting ATPase potassium-binding subunit [Cyanobacteriota bacterium erpe_2018_sw_39hr_WHONDRS-SW48-000098_B_bin.30]
MNSSQYLQIGIYLFVLVACVVPLGNYMAAIYTDKLAAPGSRMAGLEALIYRLCRVDSSLDMNWKTYAFAMLIFNTIGLLFVYLLQRVQALVVGLPGLPANIFNPQGLGGVAPDQAFNTAVSFATNTNWQSYGGETTMSYLTQMLALTVQNFVSAATGMAVLAALIRAFARESEHGIGNFWRDMTRSVIYILLPMSFVLALVLVGQGVVQTFAPYATYEPLDRPAVVVDSANSGAAASSASAGPAPAYKIALGPVASQVAIKQLGTNGGGFFNVNSSHPLENPTPFANLLEMLAILIIPAALCQTFGKMVGRPKQGLALLLSMLVLFGAGLAICVTSEAAALLPQANLPLVDGQTGGLLPANMEGKEVRFGIANSALWAVATTAASNGSVNSMHDSFSPLGGLIPMFMMQLGEVVFGGVGSGLYGLLVFAIITVFIAGLMVGRTPEFLSKKIESFEIKMCSLVILFPPMVVLLGTALACICQAGQSAVLNSGPHAFSEILYAFSSAGNNNGSAFAGLSANSLFYNTALGIAMYVARYWLTIPVLAMAGTLVTKKRAPLSPGTMPTDNLLFVTLLVGVVLIFGGLTFVPALALGPIVEHLLMTGGK